MTGETSPQPDHTDEADYTRLVDINRCALESKFQDDLHILRASIVTRLRELRCIEEGFGWAMFRIDDGTELDKVSPETRGLKDVLILLDPVVDVDGVETQRSNVRILTNQPIGIRTKDPHEPFEWLTYDITLTHDDHAVYYVDTATFEEADVVGCSTKAALFYVDDDDELNFTESLLSDGEMIETPMVYADFEYPEDKESDGLIRGSATSESDYQTRALEYAMLVFDQVSRLEPLYSFDFSE